MTPAPEKAAPGTGIPAWAAPTGGIPAQWDPVLGNSRPVLGNLTLYDPTDGSAEIRYEFLVNASKRVINLNFCMRRDNFELSLLTNIPYIKL